MRKFNINVNGKAYNVEVEEVTNGAAPAVAPATATAPAPTADGEKVSSPMPGTILDVKVNVGDTVTEGQALFILEAMKMENNVNAPCAGKVVSVNVTKGSSVETGTVLAVIA